MYYYNININVVLRRGAIIVVVNKQGRLYKPCYYYTHNKEYKHSNDDDDGAKQKKGKNILL